MTSDQKVFFQEMMAFFKPKIAAQEIKELPFEVFSALITGATHQLARQWLAGNTSRPLSDYREELADAAWSSVNNLSQS